MALAEDFHTEPPLVYYFRDHVDDMSDALKPLFPPLDGNAEDFVNAHASNINVQTGGSDAIVGAWYYRATMAPFSSKKAGASKLVRAIVLL